MDLPYEIVRSSRRTAAIHVYPGGRIVVRVPLRFPEYRIRSLVEKRNRWIERKHRDLLNTEDLSDKPVTKEMRDRARELFTDRLSVLITGESRVDLSPLRLADLGYSPDHPPKLRLRKMRRRWGSCSATGVITLNVHLVNQPVDLIDYVIVHELCHLRELNHSRRFYNLLDAVMPNWRERRRRLNAPHSHSW